MKRGDWLFAFTLAALLFLSVVLDLRARRRGAVEVTPRVTINGRLAK